MTSTTPRQAIPYPQQTDVKDVVLQFGAMSNVADDKYVLRFFNSSARDAAITSPTEGTLCYLTDSDVFTLYTGSAWTRLELGKVLRVTNRQTFSTTTPTDVTGLGFTGAANAVYQFELTWLYGSATAASQNPIAVSWRVPSGTGISRGFFAQGTGSNDRGQALMATRAFATATSAPALGGHTVLSGVVVARETGIIRIGSTAGLCVPRAQRGASVTSGFVDSDTTMTVRRIS